MRIRSLHSWNVTPKEAISIQKSLAHRVIKKDCFNKVDLVAGADIAFSKESNIAVAGVIVYSFPSLEEVERKSVRRKLAFPYIPGLLSFREAPVLVDLFRKLRTRPDVVFFDGQGIAHPRRFGIASHMGVLLDIPSVGCAKSRLIGIYKEPGARKGEYAPLNDKQEVVGAVLRTREHVKPIFVSIGHKISLETALQIVVKCTTRYRIPVPTREADIYVGGLK